MARYTVQARVSEQERSRFERAAIDAGLSLSDWVRFTLREAAGMRTTGGNMIPEWIREMGPDAVDAYVYATSEEGKAEFAKWLRTQNAAAREQGFASMDHALVATDYKRGFRK